MHQQEGTAMDLEGPEEWITIRRAAEISGLAANTLDHQARAGKLRTVHPRKHRYTTRRWLHEYLMAASERDKGQRKPLPKNYRPPE
jgi:hypothetical protein